MNIRCFYSPSQIVFITQVVKDRRRLFDDESMMYMLRQVFRAVQNHHPFSMMAYVFLPDHFHLLIKPKGDSNFSQIMHSIKRNFTNEFKRKSVYSGIR
jgi:REP element-mobilizing transposase RayT